MSPKLNLKGVIEVISELKSKVLNNFISNVSIVNSSDILLTFSFYNKEKLLICLNHNNPFVSLIDSSYNSATTLGGLNENLRKYLKGSYIINIEQINSDRVIKFSLTKTNEFYQKEVMGNKVWRFQIWLSDMITIIELCIAYYHIKMQLAII